jgi:adenylate cyclase
MSRLGSPRHQHIAATGDTVNVASRLAELCKTLKRSVVVSEALFAEAGSPESLCGETPDDLEAAIRGRAQPLRIRASN